LKERGDNRIAIALLIRSSGTTWSESSMHDLDSPFWMSLRLAREFQTLQEKICRVPFPLTIENTGFQLVPDYRISGAIEPKVLDCRIGVFV
jgi:hypothetical protein